MTLVDIATRLNERKILNAYGKKWKPQAVRALLANEKYVGSNVFNKTSTRLRTPCVRNPKEEWIQAPGSFQPLVTPNLFATTQLRLQGNRDGYSDALLLDYLTALWCQKGHLSADLIKDASVCPSTTTFNHHFGSMYAAYERVGFRRCRCSPDNAALRKQISQKVARDLIALGRKVYRRRFCDWSRLVIDDQVNVGILVLRPFCTLQGEPRWMLRHRFRKAPDISIAARLSFSGEIRDYLIVPRIALPRIGATVASANHMQIDAFKVSSLDCISDLFKRVPVAELQDNDTSQSKCNVAAIRALPQKSIQWQPRNKRRPAAAKVMLWTYCNEVRRMQAVRMRYQFAERALAALASTMANLANDPGFIRAAAKQDMSDLPCVLAPSAKADEQTTVP